MYKTVKETKNSSQLYELVKIFQKNFGLNTRIKKDSEEFEYCDENGNFTVDEHNVKYVITSFEKELKGKKEKSLNKLLEYNTKHMVNEIDDADADQEIDSYIEGNKANRNSVKYDCLANEERFVSDIKKLYE